jgi:hypothetical protein
MEVGVAPWRLVRLASPTLLKDLNVGRYADAGEQLLLWVNAGGRDNRDSWRVGRLSLSCGWELPIEPPDFQSVQRTIRGLLPF